MILRHIILMDFRRIKAYILGNVTFVCCYKIEKNWESIFVTFTNVRITKTHCAAAGEKSAERHQKTPWNPMGRSENER